MKHDWPKQEHPAYAMIGVHRMSSTGSYLFGSESLHHTVLRISIRRAYAQRDLADDHAYSGEVIAEVDLSEAQFGRFLSAPNIGDGVPCTLVYLSGERMPEVPKPERKVDKFRADMQQHLRRVIDDLDSLKVNTLQAVGSKRAREHIARQFEVVRQGMLANLPFIAKRFDDDMEASVEAAKVEIAAYLAGQINQLGLNAVQSQAPLALAAESDNE